MHILQAKVWLQEYACGFQKIMIQFVDELDDVAVVCFDNVVFLRDDPNQRWEVAVRVMHTLTATMFILNIKKAKLLVTEIKMLGFLVDWGKNKLC